MEIHLTENELNFLTGFAESEHMFLEHILGYVNQGIAPASVPGIVGSLVKKGLVRAYKYDGLDSVELTETGAPLAGW